MQRFLIFANPLKVYFPRCSTNQGGFKFKNIPKLITRNYINRKNICVTSPFLLAFIPVFEIRRNLLNKSAEILSGLPGICVCSPKADERHEIYTVNLKFRSWFYSLGNFLKLFLRCCFIFILFSPFLIFYPLKMISSSCDKIWWTLILRVIQISGPVLIKLGQWASTRRDLFPPNMCFNLSKLQHATKSHPWRYTAKRLSQYFGDNWRDSFSTGSTGEPIPVGSGCVAQVYKMYARTDLFPELKDVSKEGMVPVALKVLHPEMEEKFQRDITILRFFAKTAEFLFPSLKWVSLQDCVNEFSDFMLNQINLSHEAEMLEKFASNFKKHEMVHFPKPLYPFVNQEMLLETWEEGIPISNFVTEDVNPKMKESMAVLLINILLKMAFSDNLVHSDLHPGNIIVQVQKIDDESEKTERLFEDMGNIEFVNLKDYDKVKFKLVILDCGLTTQLSPRDFDNFFTVFRSVVLNRGDIVARTFLNNSLNECPKPEEFEKEMELLVNRFREKTLSLAQVDVGDLLGRVFNLLIYHKVKLESRFSSVMLAIIILEGLGRSLDPTKDILEEAIPYLLI